MTTRVKSAAQDVQFLNVEWIEDTGEILSQTRYVDGKRWEDYRGHDDYVTIELPGQNQHVTLKGLPGNLVEVTVRQGDSWGKVIKTEVTQKPGETVDQILARVK